MNGLCLTHFRHSKRCTYFGVILFLNECKLDFSSLFESSLYDLFSFNNSDELLISYVNVTCVFIVYYYVTMQYNIFDFYYETFFHFILFI